MISIIEIGRDSHFMPKAGDVPDKSHRQVRFFCTRPCASLQKAGGVKIRKLCFRFVIALAFHYLCRQIQQHVLRQKTPRNKCLAPTATLLRKQMRESARP